MNKLEKLKDDASGEATEALQTSWMKKPLKKSTPLKKIDVEESAVPLSIIPHGVPLKRGFGAKDASEKVLVLPTSSPIIKTPPKVTQFLQFYPPFSSSQRTTKSTTSSTTTSITTTVTTTTASTTTTTPTTTTTTTSTTTATTTTTTAPDADKDIVEIVEPVNEFDFEENEIKELIEKESESGKHRMKADMINENIEKVLEIQMPKHTKLLYGNDDADEGSQRFERNSVQPNQKVRIFIMQH